MAQYYNHIHSNVPLYLQFPDSLTRTISRKIDVKIVTLLQGLQFSETTLLLLAHNHKEFHELFI